MTNRRRNVAFTKEEYQKRLSERNEYLELTSEYINAQARVEFKCNKCGVEKQTANANSLLRGDTKCSVCGGSRIAVYGYTDITTTHPNYVAYFDNIEDAKRLKVGSLEEVNMHCPICGYKRIRSPKQLHTKNFGCPKCSDNVSYPNRFMFNMLEQLNVKFENEVIFDWSQNKRYDFVVDKTIIEMDGLFHNGSNFKSKEDAQKIDKLKDDLATLNGYEMIRVNCYESQFEFIKNNILDSKLKDIFKLDEFDWIELESRLINTNLVKRVSDIFNEYKGIKSIEEMSKMLNITMHKICPLLKTSARLGFTDYDTRLSLGGAYSPKRDSAVAKKTICLETRKIYNSCLDAEKEYGLRPDAIARVCRGERLTAKGLHFDFIETTKEIQDKKTKMLNNCANGRSSKSVYCEELDRTFISGKEASDFLGMKNTYVSTLIARGKKSREGYSFRYI